MPAEHRPVDRRNFLRATAAAAGTLGLSAATYAKAPGSLSRVNVGFIGCGGRAETHVGTLLEMEKTDKTVEIVALCDIYRPRLEKKAAMRKLITGGA